ncbi:hypothetical protein KAT84_01600 [Candidatus Bipolaricaulota bacterium]|nr:hypothetical protein [Candidatus Bipolaricaulota bacterium]
MSGRCGRNHRICALPNPYGGHAEGLRVGLWPMTGPRGLLRIYAPYLGHADDRMINYIAIEPVIQGSMARGFSELEVSQLDEVDGLRFWSANSPDDAIPRAPTDPARGIIGYDGDVETLTVYVFIEPYRSSAKVVLSLTFRADRPYEVGISTFTTEGSPPPDCLHRNRDDGELRTFENASSSGWNTICLRFLADVRRP